MREAVYATCTKVDLGSHRAVREFLKDGKKWKRKVGYGRRWAVEGSFSVLRRTFGEFVAAHRFRNMANEMVLKAFCYNILVKLSAGGGG